MKDEKQIDLKDLYGTSTSVNPDEKYSFGEEVKGINMEHDFGLDDLLKSYKNTGIQATNLFRAIQEIKKMRKSNCKIFLGATSNITSSGLREVLNYLAKNKLINVYVTTGGAIEEDIIKCIGSTKIGSFNKYKGKSLKDQGFSRIGNMVSSNQNYILFEEWFKKLLDKILKDSSEDNPKILTPSQLISLIGKEINNKESVLYWCYVNKIPVYSPAIVDGAIGDVLAFYDKRTSLKIDLVEDVRKMNTECFEKEMNGAIIVGGGLIKHHILNANIFNNGLDYCVILNTAIEYDASDAGGNLDEAVTWMKVKTSKVGVKIYGEASIIFPLLVYGGFKSKADF